MDQQNQASFPRIPYILQNLKKEESDKNKELFSNSEFKRKNNSITQPPPNALEKSVENWNNPRIHNPSMKKFLKSTN